MPERFSCGKKLKPFRTIADRQTLWKGKYLPQFLVSRPRRYKMFANPLASLRVPICSICNLPVPLNSAKTDEDGKAVHEDCYLTKLGIRVSKPVISFPKSSNVDVVKTGERMQRC